MVDKIELCRVYNLTDSPTAREMCGLKVPKILQIGGTKIAPGSWATVRRSSCEQRHVKSMISNGMISIDSTPLWYSDSLEDINYKAGVEPVNNSAPPRKDKKDKKVKVGKTYRRKK